MVKAGLIGFFLLAGSAAAGTEMTIGDTVKLLPDTIQGYRAEHPASRLPDDLLEGVSETIGLVSAAARDYSNDQGLKFSIEVIHTEKDSAAYALLTQLAQNTDTIKMGEIGVASVVAANRVLFCKGDNLVDVRAMSSSSSDQTLSFARAMAAGLPEGDEDVPVLVKHVPNGQSSAHAQYAVSLNGLKAIVPNQPILDSVSFEGGTESVAANYGQSQLVLVEFTTPQFAGDNDRTIVAKLQELKSQGQPVPTAYRRVGNYSVFVFNAPDETPANDLIDQVKYQKVVQWLGEDPHLYERLQKYFTQTSAGVLIAVLETSGLSLLVCLGLGALFGTLLFRYRRAQRATRYSDAGGTVRLNLDELTAQGNSRGLLKSSSPRESASKHP